jgi:hypothetical protein
MTSGIPSILVKTQYRSCRCVRLAAMYCAIALNQELTLMHMILHDNARHLQHLDSAITGEGVTVQRCLPAVMNLTWYHGFCEDAHDRSRMPTRQSWIRQDDVTVVSFILQ